MQTFRTFFKKEIFAEVTMPNRATQKVVIFCDGAPSVPSKRKLSEFFAKKGHAFIHMRYRGTWESKGVFLKKSPAEDLLDVVDAVAKQYKTIILMGTSFGGTALLIASLDRRVTKAIAISPVVDWSAPSRAEPMPEFKRMMKEFYGQVYRGSWDKLGNGNFYTPDVKQTDGSKIFIIHAKDDEVVRIKEVAQFAKKAKASFVALKRGGHLSSSIIAKPALWKKISKFLKTTTTTTPKSS